MKVTSSNISDIISDLSFTSTGRICYILDVSDIKDYCFPLGLDYDEKVSGNETFIKDKTASLLGLSLLLNKKIKNTYSLIPKEYYKELWSLRNQATIRIEKASKIKGKISEYLDNNDFKDIDKTIKKDFILIAALKSGLFKKGIESFSSLINPVEKRLFYENDKFENNLDIVLKKYRHKLFDIDRSPFSKKLIERIFNGLRESLHMDANEDSIFRDAYSIFMVYQLNKFLQQQEYQEFSKENKFCYFSSQIRSIKFFSKHENQDLKEAVNYRNSAHLFIHFFSRKYDDSSKTEVSVENTKNSLKRLKNSLEDQSIYKKNNLDREIDELINQYKNWGILANSRIENFESLSVVKKLDDKYQERITNIDHDVAKHSEFAQKIRDATLSFLNSFEIINDFISQSQTHISNKLGADHIEGNNQVLPICFPHAVFKENPEFNLLLKSSLTSLTEIQSMNPKDWSKMKKKVIKFLKNKDFEDTYPHKLYQDLMYSLFALLLEPKKYQELEHKLFEEIRFAQHRSKNIDTVENFNSLYVQFDYVRCWAARRQENYPESIKIAEYYTQSNSYNTDPRFHHGLTLAKYCEWYERRNSNLFKSTEEEHEKLKEILDIALHAYNLYDEPEKKTNFWNVYKCLEVLENTICYFYAYLGKQLQGTDKHNYYNNESRIFLTKLKGRISTTKWKSFPEYFHTEALLELSESRFLRFKERKTKFDKDQGLNKVNRATDAINKAITSCKNLGRESLLLRCIKLKNKIELEKNFWNNSSY